MNVSISYDKVIDTKKGIAKRAKCKEHDGVFVLSPSINNEPKFFEIDNADLKIDAVDRDRKKQLYGNVIAVYQQQLQNQTKVPIF